MCDLAKERQKIDAILARVTAMEPVHCSIDESELIEHSLAVLHDYYIDACSEACMRERCREFVERLVARRRALGFTPSAGLTTGSGSAPLDARRSPTAVDHNGL